MSVVSSEIHQDSMFLDAVQSDIFNEVFQKESSGDIPRVLTHFSSRDPSDASENHEFSIEHSRTSAIDLVGLQVWRGALILADFILSHPQLFRGKNVIEVAGGTGLTSVVASKYANHVTCTDVNRGDILDLIRSNVKLNGSQENCHVEELDFFREDWKDSLKDRLASADVLLVADVVYSRDITSHFFRTLSYLLSQNPKLEVFLAIERRCHVDGSGCLVSPNFDHFLGLLHELTDHSSTLALSKLSCDFKQYFSCYERVEALHLWQLSRRS
eukprot:maker-scaffold12_size759060-snap-gene-5.19 protein:Tk05582 transcript:maker-scaffold12_size759060-snap-gene-5.19-mRNA-1 annotation:"Uncharacterized protein C16orf68"